MIEWRCKNDHVLGFVMPYGAFNCLVLVNNRGETIAVISGRADVRCLVCDDVKTWQTTRVPRRFRIVTASLDRCDIIHTTT